MASGQLLNSKPDVSRTAAVLLCVASVIACFAYDYWRPVLPDWWRMYGGGIPYVVFWITLWFVVFPFRRCILPICIFVTAFTSLLEFMQLWKPLWLTQFRGTRFGAALLGSGFTWNDFPPYFMGGAFGLGMLMVVTMFNQQQPKKSGEANTT